MPYNGLAYVLLIILTVYAYRRKRWIDNTDWRYDPVNSLLTLTASTLTYFFGYKPTINTKGIPIEPKIEISDINLITENGDEFQFTPENFTLYILIILTILN